MPFLSEVLVPAIVVAFIIFVFGGIIVLIFILSRRVFENMGLFFKYSLFKRDYSDYDVQFCVDAMEKGWNKIELHKYLLVQGIKARRIREILYIYDKIAKMKGGVNHGQETSGQTGTA